MFDLEELERLHEAATPGPWHACNEGKCKCMQVSGEEYPIATFEDGEWGDTYPAIRYTDGRGLSGTTVEAYMEIIPYGKLGEGVGTANQLLTVALRNAFSEMAAEIRRLDAENAKMESALVKAKIIDPAKLHRLQAENARLSAECGRLREALEEYANPEHWEQWQSNICEAMIDYVWYQDMVNPMDIANRALAGEECSR